MPRASGMRILHGRRGGDRRARMTGWTRGARAVAASCALASAARGEGPLEAEAPEAPVSGAVELDALYQPGSPVVPYGVASLEVRRLHLEGRYGYEAPR